MMKGKAAVMERPGQITVREFELPEAGPWSGLLRVDAAGVCVSDSKRYDNLYKAAVFPLVMGHENVGTVYQIGDELAAATGLKAGDRIALEAGIPCGQCRYCAEGEARFCQKRRGYGISISANQPPHFWGGYAQFLYLTKGIIAKKIAPEVPPEAGTLFSPLSNGIYWVRTLGGCQIGDNVVIQGPGPQGLCAAIAAREAGALKIIVTGLGIDAERLELAREFGATHCVNVEKENLAAAVKEITGGDMADLVVDVSGSPTALQSSVEIVRKCGTILSGGVTGTETRTPLLMDKITLGEVRIQGGFSSDSRSKDVAIRILESRKYPLEKMVTHRYPVERTEEALVTVGGHNKDVYPIKAVISPWMREGR